MCLFKHLSGKYLGNTMNFCHVACGKGFLQTVEHHVLTLGWPKKRSHVYVCHSIPIDIPLGRIGLKLLKRTPEHYQYHNVELKL